jgi:hypothetical protein
MLLELGRVVGGLLLYGRRFAERRACERKRSIKRIDLEAEAAGFNHRRSVSPDEAEVVAD